jgi:hemerythrin
MSVEPIEWNDDLSIGDPEIDAEHQELIERIALIPEPGSPDDAQALADALAYAGKHFRAEEAFMQQIGYPGLAQHRGDHRVLTQALLAYKREFDAGSRDLYTLKQYLFRWARDHIRDEDRKIGIYLASQGAE